MDDLSIEVIAMKARAVLAGIIDDPRADPEDRLRAIEIALNALAVKQTQEQAERLYNDRSGGLFS